MTDAFGRTLSFTYDGLGCLSKVADSTGRIVTSAYTNGDLTGFTDAQNHSWTMTYDSEHRLTGIVNPRQHTSVTNVYDSQGRVITQTNARGKAWHFHYGGYRNFHIDPLERRTEYYFDGEHNLIATIAPEGNRSRNEYDGQGHLVAGYLPSMPDTPAVVHVYDGRQNLIRTTRGGAHAFVYDNRGLLTSLTNPLGKSYAYTYDGGGNLTARTDAKNQTIVYSYGPTDQLTQKSYPDGSSVTYAHDDADRRTTMIDGNGTSQFVYDGRDLLTRYTNPYGISVNCTHGRDGFRQSMGWCCNSLAYVWDNPRGVLTDLGDATSVEGRAAHWTVDPFLGHLRSSMISFLPSGGTDLRGFVADMAYDRAFRLTRLTNAALDRGNLPEYGEVADYAFALDGLGSRRAEVRLEPAQPAFAAGSLALTFNAADQISTAGYAYDDNGNLTAKPGYSLAYDYENRLVSVTGPHGTTAYAYDGDGNRLSATHNGVVTSYLVDPAAAHAPVIAELDAHNVPLRRYVYGAGRLLWQEDAAGRAYHYI